MTLKRLVIATTERSGSTLLAAMLQAHPGLKSDTVRQAGFEPVSLNRRRERGFLGNVEYVLPMLRLQKIIAAAEAEGVEGYFCKVFPFHVWRYSALLHRLARDGWTVLELRRASVFRQAISLMAARRFGSFHAYDGQPIDVEPMRFPQRRLLEILAGCEDQRRELEAACAPLKRMTLMYERDLADRTRQQATFDRVTDYIGVARHAVQTSHERPFRRPYHEIILNYHELEAAAEQFLLEKRRNG